MYETVFKLFIMSILLQDPEGASLKINFVCKASRTLCPAPSDPAFSPPTLYVRPLGKLSLCTRWSNLYLFEDPSMNHDLILVS